MKKILILVCFICLTNNVFAEISEVSYTLSEAIDYALKNNPALRSSSIDVEIEAYEVKAAKAEKMPKLDFSSGVVRYRYPSPVTPISGSPLAGVAFPEFDDTIYDLGVSFNLPLYRGGRLDRGVRIAEIKKSIAEDLLHFNRQELIYNLSSVYYKILQLEKLHEASEAAVKQLEEHKKNVELFLKVGTVPQVELLKTETELAHEKQNTLIIKNNIESAYELLKNLMGIEYLNRKISIVHETSLNTNYPVFEESCVNAFSQRPDYRAVLKRQKLAEERVMLVEGKRFPNIYLNGEYFDRTGEHFEFKENWNLALRLSMPIYDGGSIKAEVNRERKEVEKTKEEQRSLKLEIIREIKDAYLNIENAQKRIDVSQMAIDEAKENLRIELLKYETGAGTSTDVIDAKTSLLRAQADYYQALYGKDIAIASLRKATGEKVYVEEVSQ